VQDQPQPLVVLMEDDLIHTPESPFCSDTTCPCREDPLLLAELDQQVTDGLLTPDEATAIVLGKTL